MRLNTEITSKSKILEIILRKIESDYPNDVSLLVCYGSFIKGTMHTYSDIDFFFIPKTKKGYQLSFQFIIKGIGYDLWPVSWERVKKISELKDPLSPLLIEGRVLYFSSKEDIDKYSKFVTDLKTNLNNRSRVEIDHSTKTEEVTELDPDNLIGFYEELKSIYNKLRHACEIKDMELALYASKIIDKETVRVQPFTRELLFPSLLETCKSEDFEKIQEVSDTHEKLLLDLFAEMKIPLNIFKTEEEFETVFKKI